MDRLGLKNAKNKFALPHNNKSGTRTNSKAFIVAMTTICVIVLRRVHKPLKIHTAIPISESPIRIVKGLELSTPKICPTIC